MSDLVKRLRDGEAHYSAVLIEGLNGYSLQLFKDAADEIERLRELLRDVEAASKDGVGYAGISYIVRMALWKHNKGPS
jgi:hypothetical protein